MYLWWLHCASPQNQQPTSIVDHKYIPLRMGWQRMQHVPPYSDPWDLHSLDRTCLSWNAPPHTKAVISMHRKSGGEYIRPTERQRQATRACTAPHFLTRYLVFSLMSVTRCSSRLISVCTDCAGVYCNSAESRHVETKSGNVALTGYTGSSIA